MAGVYISYPFCAQKCTYCNFASGVFPRQMQSDYQSALLDELRGCSWTWRPETVYLGGGTPSQMDAGQLRAILASLPGCPWNEATIEAAPGSFGREQVRAWVDAGLNRVSLGTQSFVESELKRTGRKHTPESVADDIELLRECGVTRINLDLIAGLAGQTLDSFSRSLDWVERLCCGHVSVYMLEVDEDSRLGLEILNGGERYGARDIPDDGAIAEMYQVAVERLASLGIHRYEISNFARSGEESLHNLKYWQHAPYFGFGADAHSFEGGARWRNAETATEYVRRSQAGLGLREPAEAADIPSERFFIGLRLSAGIEPSPEEWRHFAAAIGRFLGDGLLESDGRRLRLTDKGVLFSNEVFQEFLVA